MKNILVALMLSCWAATAAVAQPTQTQTEIQAGGLSVGKDNLTRVLWLYGPNSGAPQFGSTAGYQAETVYSNGSVFSLGPQVHPPSFAAPSVLSLAAVVSIATGPYNDTSASWEGFTTTTQFGTNHLSWTNNLLSTQIIALPFPAQLNATAMDVGDNTWYFSEDSSENAYFTQCTPSGTIGINYSIPIADGPYWIGFALSYDGFKLLLHESADSHGGITTYLTKSNRASLFTVATDILVVPPMTSDSVDPWEAFAVSTTADGHTQVYWHAFDDYVDQYILAIWDIAPTGAIAYSPIWVVGGQPVAAAACVFPGGDGQLRVAVQNLPFSTYSLMTIDPKTWNINNWVNL